MKGHDMTTRQEQIEALEEMGIEVDHTAPKRSAKQPSQQQLLAMSDIDPDAVYAKFNAKS
jgi:hypothetical protein